MKSQFEEFLTLKSLSVKYSGGFNAIEQLQRLVDAGAVSHSDGTPITSVEDALGGQVQNLCAKVPTLLVDRITKVTGELEISKREFIEAALFDACDRASVIIEDLDIHVFYRSNPDFVEVEK